MKITSSGKSLFSSHPDTNTFLDISTNFLQNNGSSLRLYNYHNRFGYYIYESKTLEISRPEKFKKSKKTWLDLYVHEYCHFLQQYYETPIYKAYWEPLKYIISTEKEMKTKDPKIIRKHLKAIRKMETECCKMSIGLIKFYKLPINIKMSAKVSNAYIFYHHLVEENNTWKSKNFYTKGILDQMPTRIRSDYADNIPERYHQILTRCF